MSVCERVCAREYVCECVYIWMFLNWNSIRTHIRTRARAAHKATCTRVRIKQKRTNINSRRHGRTHTCAGTGQQRDSRIIYSQFCTTSSAPSLVLFVSWYVECVCVPDVAAAAAAAALQPILERSRQRLQRRDHTRLHLAQPNRTYMGRHTSNTHTRINTLGSHTHTYTRTHCGAPRPARTIAQPVHFRRYRRICARSLGD